MFASIGKICLLEEAALDYFHSQLNEVVKTTKEKANLKSSDIYKELRLRGYDYGQTFQGILESNSAGLFLMLETFHMNQLTH